MVAANLIVGITVVIVDTVWCGRYSVMRLDYSTVAVACGIGGLSTVPYLILRVNVLPYFRSGLA